MALVNYQDEARIAYLRWASSIEDEEARKVRLWRDYVAGDHPVRLTDRQKEFIGLKGGAGYAHNICSLVVAMAVERLHVQGFSPLGAEAEPLAALAREWWEHNRMDALQDDLFYAAARDGAAYLMVDWDGEAPRWTLHYAWDGTQGVSAYTDPDTGAIRFFSKRWTIYDPTQPERNGRTRMNLYFPDRIEKYISTRGGQVGLGGLRWEPYEEEDNGVWPLPWVDAHGEPLGLALVEFANPGGGSEIQDLLPIQDMLNKSDLDLIAAADAAGFRIIYMAGVPPQTDPRTGEERTITLSPGKAIRFTESAARVGVIDPVDLSQLINACRYWITVAAGLTRTPQYLLQAMGADQPSGESLRMQEMGLIAKCHRKQAVWGNALEDVIYLSARLWNLYRPVQSVPLGRVQTQWKEVATRDEAALMQGLLQKLQMGVPQAQLWAEMGYSREQIAGFERMRDTAGKVGSELLRQFLAGRGQRVERPEEGIGGRG